MAGSLSWKRNGQNISRKILRVQILELGAILTSFDRTENTLIDKTDEHHE
jgi:hypothetical protein